MSCIGRRGVRGRRFCNEESRGCDYEGDARGEDRWFVGRVRILFGDEVVEEYG